MEDHARGCEGRNYTCTCGYDDEAQDLRQLIQEHVIVIEMQKEELQKAREKLAEVIMQQDEEFQRLKRIEQAVKRLAYVVRKSVNSGPLSKNPTQEAEAWRRLRITLGEGYDERGNLVPIGQ